VAIGTVTLIISDAFKEREQDIKELEYFDKYAQDVKKADGITERFQLSKYLSIVAPSGEMKKSWEEYYKTVKAEYNEYLVLKKEEKKLDTIQNPTPKEIQKIQDIKDKIISKESPIISTSSVKESDLKIAASWEKKGFYFLLNKDIENAINAFHECEKTYNSYHMAYEISNYLVKKRSELINPYSTEWKNTFQQMAQNFSYKMPFDIKKEFIQNSK
jgi:hypothetical protein